MQLHTEVVRYGKDQAFSGLLMKPERATGLLPAVIVIQEIWGVDEHIEDVTRRFAEAGYVAFAPDLYAKQGERLAGLDKDRVEAVKAFLETVPPSAWQNAEERAAAMEKLPDGPRQQIQQTFATLFGGLDRAEFATMLTSAAAWLRDECAYSKGQGVVSIGFCMGGALSGRLACLDPQLRGAAIFYGDAPSNELLSAIQCPVRGFYGGLDPRITNAVPGFAQAMKDAGKDFAYTVYDDAQHAFFNDSRRSYHVTASRDAFAQTLSFFHTVLG
ncbi:MAG: dienelactone hydrolase family protein [Firmicutes bacterium]|nr:dienelactone hydrolase family protein [Bacillota bacterium]